MSTQFESLDGPAFGSAVSSAAAVGGTDPTPVTRWTFAGWDYINGEMYPAWVEDPAEIA